MAVAVLGAVATCPVACAANAAEPAGADVLQAYRAASPVTDYIAVSSNALTGASASNDVNAMAVGPSSAASGAWSSAVGAGAAAVRAGATSVGSRSTALGIDSTAIGNSASTGFNGDRAVSIGYMASADGADAIGFGSFAIATGPRSIAIGSNAVVTSVASDGIALGTGSSAVASGAVALGSGAVANRGNSVSIGNASMQRQLINLAAGTAGTDAVNVAQLYGLGASVASAFGGGASIAADGTFVAPIYRIGGSVFRNVGDALGNLDGRVTSNASAIDDVNVRINQIINSGVEPRYFHANSTLPDSLATGADSVAIGGGAKAAFANSVALGANAVADRANSVSVGATGAERQITHVAAGTADTDAVNVAQLRQAGLVDGNGRATSAVVYDLAGDQVDYANVTLGQGVAGGTAIHNVANGVLANDAVNLGQLNDAINQIANAQIQGGASPFVNATGDVNTEAAAASGSHATAVGAVSVANGDLATALGAGAQAVSASATAAGAQAVASGANASAFGAGSQAMASGSVALGAGSVADRANTVSVGQAGAERQVTNVAPGTQGTDAVNLNQLNSAVGGAYQSLHDLDTSTRKGIASASALQIVTPYLPGRTTLNAGMAGYRGQAALGVGVSRWNEKGTINFNAGVATAGSTSTIVRAGIGIVLGN